jgi:hypothetical protein
MAAMRIHEVKQQYYCEESSPEDCMIIFIIVIYKFLRDHQLKYSLTRL